MSKSFAVIVALILGHVITTPDRQVLGIQKRCRYLTFSGVSKIDAYDGYRTNVDQTDEGKCSLVAK